MRRIAMMIIPAFLCAAGSLAACYAQDYVQPYIVGEVRFDYAQFPMGPYEGSFASNGWAFSTDFADPETFVQSVGGFITSTDDSTAVALYAAVRNPDETVDLAVLWVQCEGAVPVSGDFAVDPLGMTTIYAFLDDIVDFTFPEDLGQDSLEQWLAAVDAQHILVSISGNVHIEGADARGMTGSFSGLMADDGLLVVSVQNGFFDLEGVCIANESLSWSDLKRSYR